MKKSKVILFDVDGVLIRLPNYFGEELERRGYKGVEEILNYYYKGIDNWDCLEGKAIAEERIMPYLKKFGWKGTGQEYFKQQFKFEKQFLDVWNRFKNLDESDKKDISQYEHPKEKLSHYSKKTVDIEYEFPFGKSELFGFFIRQKGYFAIRNV